MYFIELENLKEGRKIRRISWTSDRFVFWMGGYFVRENKDLIAPEDFNIFGSDWVYYQEPKKLKRYWLWAFSFDNSPWQTSYYFYNDLGLDTTGDKAHMFCDKDYKKQKIESIFIDVEE